MCVSSGVLIVDLETERASSSPCTVPFHIRSLATMDLYKLGILGNEMGWLCYMLEHRSLFSSFASMFLEWEKHTIYG